MPAQPDEIWDAIRDELRRETPDFKFHIWLEPLELAAIRGHTVYVRAPEHIRTSVAERYLPLLRRAAAAGFDAQALVEVVGEDWERARGRQSSRPERRRGEPAAADGRHSRPPEPEVHLRPVRDRRRQPLRARRRARRSPSCPATPTTRSSCTARPASARRTCFTRSATTSSATAAGLQVRYATIEEFTTRVRGGRARKSDGRLQAALPRRRRRPDRRRAVPRRPRPHARGVLPHLQLAARRRAPARHDLRSRPRGHPGRRGAADRALPLGPRGRARARPRSAVRHRDPRQARPRSTTSRSTPRCWPRSRAA